MSKPITIAIVDPPPLGLRQIVSRPPEGMDMPSIKSRPPGPAAQGQPETGAHGAIDTSPPRTTSVSLKAGQIPSSTPTRSSLFESPPLRTKIADSRQDAPRLRTVFNPAVPT